MQARQDISAVLDELKKAFPKLLQVIQLNTEEFDQFTHTLPDAAHIRGFVAAVRNLKERARLFHEFKFYFPHLSLSGFDAGLRTIMDEKLLYPLLLSVTQCNLDDLIACSPILFHEETGPEWLKIPVDSFSQLHLDAIIALCKVEQDETLIRQNFLDYVTQHMLTPPSQAASSSMDSILGSVASTEPALSDMARMLWRVYGHKIPDVAAQNAVCLPLNNYRVFQFNQQSNNSTFFTPIAVVGSVGAKPCLDRIRRANYERFDTYSDLSAYQVLALSMLACTNKGGIPGDYSPGFSYTDQACFAFLSTLIRQLETCQNVFKSFYESLHAYRENWQQFPARELLYIFANSTAALSQSLTVSDLSRAGIDESRLSIILIKRSHEMGLGIWLEHQCDSRQSSDAHWYLQMLMYVAQREDAPEHQRLLLAGFPIAVQLGQIDEVTWLYERIDPVKKAQLLAADNHPIFHRAVDSASIPVMNFLFELLETPEQRRLVVTANDYAVIDAALTTPISFAARKVLLEKLAAWVAPVPIHEILVAHDFYAFDQVFSVGDTETLDWMMERLPEEQRLPAIDFISTESVEKAAQVGYIHAIAWLLNRITQSGNTEAVNRRIAVALPVAEMAGQTQMVSMLLAAQNDSDHMADEVESDSRITLR